MNKFLINSTNAINIIVAATIILFCFMASLIAAIGPDEVNQYMLSVNTATSGAPVGSGLDWAEYISRFRSIGIVIGGTLIGIVIASILCGIVATLIDIRKQLITLNANGGGISNPRIEPTL